MRFVGGDDGAGLEVLALENLVVLACCQDGVRHQHRVASVLSEPRLRRKVENDVLSNAFKPRLRPVHVLHSGPFLLQPCTLPLVESPRLRIEPGVDCGLVGNFLRDVARLIG